MTEEILTWIWTIFVVEIFLWLTAIDETIGNFLNTLLLARLANADNESIDDNIDFYTVFFLLVCGLFLFFPLPNGYFVFACSVTECGYRNARRIQRILLFNRNGRSKNGKQQQTCAEKMYARTHRNTANASSTTQTHVVVHTLTVLSVSFRIMCAQPICAMFSVCSANFNRKCSSRAYFVNMERALLLLLVNARYSGKFIDRWELRTYFPFPFPMEQSVIVFYVMFTLIMCQWALKRPFSIRMI